MIFPEPAPDYILFVVVCGYSCQYSVYVWLYVDLYRTMKSLTESDANTREDKPKESEKIHIRNLIVPVAMMLLFLFVSGVGLVVKWIYGMENVFDILVVRVPSDHSNKSLTHGQSIRLLRPQHASFVALFVFLGEPPAGGKRVILKDRDRALEP
jgi:hypothetical protein